MDPDSPIDFSSAELWDSLEPYFPPLHPPRPPSPPPPPRRQQTLPHPTPLPDQVLPRPLLPHPLQPRPALPHPPQPNRAPPHLLRPQGQQLIAPGPSLSPLAMMPRPTLGAFPSAFVTVGAPPVRLGRQGVLRPPVPPPPNRVAPHQHIDLQQQRRRKDVATASCRVPASEALTTDALMWRKYGKRSIKGSPYPREYYRCRSHRYCVVRKTVERSARDPTRTIVTYFGMHRNDSGESSVPTSGSEGQGSGDRSENDNDQNVN